MQDGLWQVKLIRITVIIETGFGRRASMTQASINPAIEKSTHQSWAEWLVCLESIDAVNLSHTEIAQRVQDKLKGTQESSGWWAQSIAVAYEQHIGRRKPGQRSDGSYQVCGSKTVDGTMDEALQAWLHLVDGKQEFSGIAIAKAPITSSTDKRRHWGCGLSDGSQISFDVNQKTPEKTLVAITQTKLNSEEDAARCQVFWKNLLDTF
jgi:hypothetical protein